MYSLGGSVRDKCFRITKELDISEIDWTTLTSALERRGKKGELSSEQQVDRFVKRLRNPLSLSWFWGKSHGKEQEQIALALCEQYGADKVILTLQRPLMSGTLRSQISQRLVLSPMHDPEQGEPSYRYEAKLGIPFVQLSVNSLSRAIIANIILFLLAVVSFAAVFFCFLYCISVLALFLVSPAEVTIAATENAAIGLALLAILMILAGVFGRWVKRTMRYIGISQAQAFRKE